MVGRLVSGLVKHQFQYCFSQYYTFKIDFIYIYIYNQIRKQNWIFINSRWRWDFQRLEKTYRKFLKRIMWSIWVSNNTLILNVTRKNVQDSKINYKLGVVLVIEMTHKNEETHNKNPNLNGQKTWVDRPQKRDYSYLNKYRMRQFNIIIFADKVVIRFYF